MPPKRVRYYSADDFEVGLTRSQLKRASRARQIEYMEHWFRYYFEDPGHETPRDEGDFVYIWGGPYDAREQLYEEFGDLVSDERIDEVTEELERSGTLHWAPTYNHPDQLDGRDRDDDPDDYVPGDPVRPTPIEDRLASLERALQAGARPSFGLPEERQLRDDILGRIASLEAELAKLKPEHGGVGHNGPPGEIETPNDLVREVKEATTQIKEELVKPEPEAKQVVTASKVLTAVLSWVGAKLNNFVDAAVKSAGATTGKVLVPFLMIAGLGLWERITGLITTIADKAASWLELVTFLPF